MTEKLRKTGIIIILLVVWTLTVSSQPVPKYRIFGFVTDNAGLGVQDANITITGVNSNLVWTGTTAERGFYDTEYSLQLTAGETLNIQASSGNVSKTLPISVSGASMLLNIQLSASGLGARYHQLRLINVYDVVGVPGDLVNQKFYIRNTGDYDERDVSVFVTGMLAYWKQPGKIKVREIKKGDILNVTVQIEVPNNATPGVYRLRLNVEDGDTAEEEFNFVVRRPSAANVSGESTTIVVQQATCSDGIQNQGEEDVDCGGPCQQCSPKTTTLPVTSTITTTAKPSTITKPAVIETPTCFDGIKNQGEEETDCGGPCQSCPQERLLGIITVAAITALILIALALIYLTRKKDESEEGEKGAETGEEAVDEKVAGQEQKK